MALVGLGALALVREGVAAMTDQERERLIDSYATILELAREPDWKRLAAAEMARLIKDRSPQKVEQMERERGLRAS